MLVLPFSPTVELDFFFQFMLIKQLLSAQLKNYVQTVECNIKSYIPSYEYRLFGFNATATIGDPNYFTVEVP